MFIEMKTDTTGLNVGSVSGIGFDEREPERVSRADSDESQTIRPLGRFINGKPN